MNKIKDIVILSVIYSLLFPLYSQGAEKSLPETFAYYFYKKGDFLNAIEGYSKILKESPKNMKIAYNLGCLYVKAGDYTSAIKKFDKVIQSNSPLKKEALYNLAVIYGKFKSDKKKALVYYNKYKNLKQ